MKQEKKNEKKIFELIKKNETKELLDMFNCKLNTVVYSDEELNKYTPNISALLVKLAKTKNYDYRIKNNFKIEAKEITMTFD
jgi:hypothetical protein